jgi:hypothetical protein
MEAELQTHVAFHLTGRRPGSGLEAVDDAALRPALLARYRDLAMLRYDFPLVLVRNPGTAPAVRPLSALIDRALEKIAQGDDGEKVSHHVLRLERQIRAQVAEGARATLSSHWDAAVRRLSGHGDDELQASLKRARVALAADGELVDCDAAMPATVFTHLWQAAQEAKARELAATIRRLSVRLAEILRADFVRSDEGRSAASLRAAIGGTQGSAFDFDAMSRLLTRAAPKAGMPASRRARIESLLATLQAQAFVAAADAGTAPYTFAYSSCTGAVAAWRERLPKAVELARAIAMAELEVGGEYREGAHDDYFAAYGSDGLAPEERALFPDYLVTQNAAEQDAAESAMLLELLAARLPIKVLVRCDDLFEESPLADGLLG